MSKSTEDLTSSAKTQTKRHKPDSEDSPDKLTCLLSRPVDTCGHCNKKCTTKDRAIQCDLCSTWVHANCENLTNDQYKVLGSSANIVYYCNFNSCASRVKYALAEWMHTSSSVITSLKESHSKFLLEYENLRKNLTDLSGKLDTLQSSETELHNHIKDTTTALSTMKPLPNVPASFNTTDIVDEYLDRERRKSNLIIYGIPESTGSTPDERKSSDNSYFTDLVHSEFKLDTVEITKSARLGKRIEGKARPLLITLMDSYVRGHILRNAKTLRNSSSYQNV